MYALWVADAVNMQGAVWKFLYTIYLFSHSFINFHLSMFIPHTFDCTAAK